MKAGPLPLAAVRVQLVSEPTRLAGGWFAAAENAAAAAWELIGQADREHLVVFFVDNYSRVKAVHTVGVGVANSAFCDVAGLFRAALLAGARGVLAVHNHPGGSAEFSPDDRRLWLQLQQAGDLLGIKLHDFLVVTPSRTTWSSIARETEAGTQAERQRKLEGYQRRHEERQARGNRTSEERQAFAVAIAGGQRGPVDLVPVPGGQVTLHNLARRLYGATAPLPDPAREALGMRPGATFAGAARRLLGSWKLAQVAAAAESESPAPRSS